MEHDVWQEKCVIYAGENADINTKQEWTKVQHYLNTDNFSAIYKQSAFAISCYHSLY